MQVRNREHDLGEVEARELLAEGALAVKLEEEVAPVDEVEQQVQLGAGLQQSTFGLSYLYEEKMTGLKSKIEGSAGEYGENYCL